jgi:hypothetical protein
MSDVTEKVRETFETVARDVPVPPFDEPALRRKVAEAKRRRGLRLTAGLAAAASVAAVAAYAVPALLEGGGSDGTTEVAGAPVTVHPDALRSPLYYSAGTHAFAATPDGEVHDLGRFESVVGSTAEGVLLVGTDSVPVWIGAATSSEGDGAYSFERGSGPVSLPRTGPVQSVALSGDGRWFAWVDLDEVVTVYDLKAEQVVQSTEMAKSTYVSSVSDRGALVSENGDLKLLAGERTIEVPTQRDGYGWLSDTAGDVVTVVDRDDVTRVYDVTTTAEHGTGKLVDSVPGTGRLAPYSLAVVSVAGDEVRVWSDGGPTLLTGLEGAPQSAGWLDEDYAMVTTADERGTTINVCPVADGACTAVVFSRTDVRLAE